MESEEFEVQHLLIFTSEIRKGKYSASSLSRFTREERRQGKF
jgi:hypothetical protein